MDKSKMRVSDIISMENIKDWHPNELIIIEAGTGAGIGGANRVDQWGINGGLMGD